MRVLWLGNIQDVWMLLPLLLLLCAKASAELQSGICLQVIELAHHSGSLVGLTAGDANVVKRHYDEIWHILSKGIDILFANRCASKDTCFTLTAVSPPYPKVVYPITII